MCYALSTKTNYTQRRHSHEKHNTGHQVLSSDCSLRIFILPYRRTSRNRYRITSASLTKNAQRTHLDTLRRSSIGNGLCQSAKVLLRPSQVTFERWLSVFWASYLRWRCIVSKIPWIIFRFLCPVFVD